MTAMSLLLAATLLSSLQDETPDLAAARAADVAAETLAATNAPSATGKTVRITSERADYDRRDGVIFLSGDVCVEDPEFNMHSDKLHVFVDPLNQLKRIVVTGHVAITNGLKNGACDRATFVKDLHRIVMFGAPGRPARLVDDSKKRNVIEGSQITFWTDSEQVEVVKPAITLEGGFQAGDAMTGEKGEATSERREGNFTAKTEEKKEKGK